MDKLGKYFSLCLVVILIVSSLFILESVDAQSASKPSAPEFTIEFPNDQTIQIVIENQAFTSSSSVNAIIYYYKVKDHNSQQWVIDYTYKLQSDSETTTITIPSVPGPLFPPMIYSTILNNSTLIDFQVQAKTGYYAISNVSGPPALISPAPQQWHTEITFNESATSDWSSSLTVDLNEMAVVTPIVTPSPSTFTPTVTPFSTVESSTTFIPVVPDSTFLLIAFIVVVLVVAVVAVVLVKRQKKTGTTVLPPPPPDFQ